LMGVFAGKALLLSWRRRGGFEEFAFHGSELGRRGLAPGEGIRPANPAVQLAIGRPRPSQALAAATRW
jgi:hypothetical protein